MTQRQLVFVVLIVVVPTAAVLVVARVGAVDAAPAAERAVPAATSDAATVGVVSVSFLVAGVLLAAAYRHSVFLYRRWGCAPPPDEGRPTPVGAGDELPEACETLPRSQRGPGECTEGGQEGGYSAVTAEIRRWHLLFGESGL